MHLKVHGVISTGGLESIEKLSKKVLDYGMSKKRYEKKEKKVDSLKPQARFQSDSVNHPLRGS